MRSYRFQYDDIFKFGLVTENPQSVTNNGFVRMQNIYPWDGAACYRDKFQTVETKDSTAQVIQIGSYIYHAYSTGIDLLVGTEYQTVLTFPKVTDTAWSYADFAKFGIITNGDVQIFVDSLGALSLVSPSNNLPKANATMNLHGQVILGGILDGWNNLDQTYVAWSKIGSMDFTVDKGNEAGFHCPNIGLIQAVRQCNRSFVAIGTEGVAVYTPAEQTFAFNKIFNIGTRSVACTASSEQEVYFIDTLGYLRKVAFTQAIDRASHAVSLLGYSWLFEGHDCKMHWCDAEMELRIVVDNQKTYILNQYGMYETNLAIVGSMQIEDGSVLCSVFGDQVLGDAYLETNPENANISGFKSITEVYMVDSSPCDKFISVVSVVGNKEYKSKEYKVNALHVVTPNVSVDNFRIAYRVPNYLTDGDGTSNEAAIHTLAIQTVKTDGRYGRGYQPGQMPTGG